MLSRVLLKIIISKKNIMNVGILTSGGLCPGLNTVIRNVVLKELSMNKYTNVYGYHSGFHGLNKNIKTRLTEGDVTWIQDKAGTILCTSRERLSIGEASSTISTLDKIYCIGGNGTLEAAKLIHKSFFEVNVVGIAKTIDNDIHQLNSFGYQTAADETSKCIRCAYTEAKSMQCIVFIETMGRNSGFLAAHSTQASAGFVDYCIVPESPIDTHTMFEHIVHTYDAQNYCVVVVSEGVNYDVLYRRIKEARKTKRIVPGYIVRSCKPNISDIILATNMATQAVTKSYVKKNFIQGVDKDISFDEFETGERMLNLDEFKEMTDLHIKHV